MTPRGTQHCSRMIPCKGQAYVPLKRKLKACQIPQPAAGQLQVGLALNKWLLPVSQKLLLALPMQPAKGHKSPCKPPSRLGLPNPSYLGGGGGVEGGGCRALPVGWQRRQTSLVAGCRCCQSP